MNRQFSLGKNKSSNSMPANKRWLHPPEALLNGHLVYNVKFLGEVEVDQPKGTEVVKEAIRKMKFSKQIKKAEGQKPPKVELAVSMNGVTIQDPKTKIVQGQHPLHRISYCADDKSDKRMFTFISKDADSNTHNCYVFDSEKCAEQITLTIGQAFDLAYKKFLETSNKDLDTKKQYLLLQKKSQQLTQENQELRQRVATLEALVPPNVLREHNKNTQNNHQQPPDGAGDKPPLLFDEEINTTLQTSPAQTNGAHTAFFTPHRPQPARTQGMPSLPPPPVPSRTGVVSSPPPVGSHVTSPQQNSPAEGLDLFGATPFTAAVTSPISPPRPVANPNPFAAQVTQDPFGMPEFNPSPADLDQQIQNVDKELMDLQIWEEAWPWNFMGDKTEELALVQ